MREEDIARIHGAAYRELARRFGGYLRTYTQTVSPGGVGTATRMLQADADRVYVMFFNTGAGGVQVSPSPKLITQGGFTIQALAEREFNLTDHATLPTEEWWVNGAVPDAILCIFCRLESQKLGGS